MADIRPLFWVGSSKRDLKEFPDDVVQNVGFALHQAQLGDEHSNAKALKGFGGRGVLEVVERNDGDTYRAVYTVRLEAGVYVLHCFQKKAKHGVQTPQADMDLIRKRLRDAEDDDAKAAERK
jgi:phage-related protein